ncbi:MAG TPA: TIGR03118 family protein [Spongiibacteraceae bacterium]
MKPLQQLLPRVRTQLITAFAAASLGLLLSSHAAAGNFYEQRNLVSDGAVAADHVDSNLVNAWGLAFNPTGPVWVSNNGTGTSTLYDGAGDIIPLVVTIPGPITSADPGKPTGIIFNGSSDFVITQGTKSGPGRFIFATEQGTLAGWVPNIDMTHALTVIDNSKQNAIYKGLALSAGGNGSLLYATDFHNGKIDVFDGKFAPVQIPGKFVDPYIPPGFGPFGIQAINGDIYVTYAKQGPDKVDDVHGKGLGVVDVFDPNGYLLRRIATGGPLNAPWGLALAPAGFGRFAGALLIGNFGDGRISAYDPVTGWYLGQLRTKNHRPLEIDGLWGLAFGNGFAGQPVNTLYFTAGPAAEAHGLYGSVSAKASKDFSPFDGDDD